MPLPRDQHGEGKAQPRGDRTKPARGAAGGSWAGALLLAQLDQDWKGTLAAPSATQLRVPCACPKDAESHTYDESMRKKNPNIPPWEYFFDYTRLGVKLEWKKRFDSGLIKLLWGSVQPDPRGGILPVVLGLE